MRKMVPVILAVFLCLSVSSLAGAASLDKVQFIKISPQDQKAVMKTPDGKLQVVKPGDVVGEKTKIVQINEGQIVLERPGRYGTETLIVTLQNGQQKIDRMERRPLTQGKLPAQSEQTK